MNKIKILFLGANPEGTAFINISKEFKEIRKKIWETDNREVWELITETCASPDDLLFLLNHYKPEIVHFSSHGSPSGAMVLQEDNSKRPILISPQGIDALFTALKDNVKMVVFNGCYLAKLAQTVTKTIDCSIGISSSIEDKAAIIFSASFYQALGFGRSVKSAYDQGIAAVKMKTDPKTSSKANLPKLFTRTGVNPDDIVLIETPKFYDKALDWVTNQNFAVWSLGCAAAGAVVGGLLWNLLNLLLNWVFHSGGSGNEPHGVAAFLWGVVSFLPVILFAFLAGYRYIYGKSIAKLSQATAIFCLFGGLGAVIFYDLGFRVYFEGLNLGYNSQELIIVVVWAGLLSVLTTIPFLMLKRYFSGIFESRYLWLQIVFSIVFTLFAVLVSLFYALPPAAVAMLRGFFAGVALRVGLFTGLVFSIAKASPGTLKR